MRCSNEKRNNLNRTTHSVAVNSLWIGWRQAMCAVFGCWSLRVLECEMGARASTLDRHRQVQINNFTRHHSTHRKRQKNMANPFFHVALNHPENSSKSLLKKCTLFFHFFQINGCVCVCLFIFNGCFIPMNVLIGMNLCISIIFLCRRFIVQYFVAYFNLIHLEMWRHRKKSHQPEIEEVKCWEIISELNFNVCV